MENNTKVLTEKQQAVWDLRQKGLTKKKIAETLGLSVNMVTTHLANAERRFREYERYLAQEEKNNQIIDIDLTRGELEMIVYAICEYLSLIHIWIGMKGYRTLTLQRMLNQQGANLDVDGEYGSMTMESVKTYQVTNGLLATGVADQVTLEMLGLLNDESATPIKNTVKVIGETVRCV